jgi:6-pyruvoyltetrahydropterin/6-carboxytetrahydropterin synthase|tara:strand:- start:9 stop:461 length:453 start_codon:yes stop_codon:yes gene_type:complete
MSKIRITKQFSFETGHALYGHDGKCKNIHGHSYRLNVTLFGTPIVDESSPKFGMIMDFSDLKKIVKETVVTPFDHSTIFNKNTPHSKLAEDLKSSGHKVVLVNYQPTSEMLVIDFAERIKKRLPANVRLHALKLRETASCYAEWYASDNE